MSTVNIVVTETVTNVSSTDNTTALTVTNNVTQVTEAGAGTQGPAGPTGPAGPGVAVGGTTDQILVKNSATNYDTKWVTNTSTGGTVTNVSGTAPLSVATGTTTPVISLDQTALAINASQVTAGTLAVARGGTGIGTATGSAGSVVLSNSPTIASPTLQNPTITGTMSLNTVTLSNITLPSTAPAGTIEYAGNSYYSNNTDGRGIIPQEQWIIASASGALTSTTAFQAIFASTNTAQSISAGAFTPQTNNTYYYFEGHVVITGMSATSGNALFGLMGTAPLTDCNMTFFGHDQTTLANAAAAGTSAHRNSTQTSASVLQSTVGTSMSFWVMGTFKTGNAAAGLTIIPSIGMVTASAATVSAGSWFKFKRLGALVTTNNGWS